MARKDYDSRCGDLAAAFLADWPALDNEVKRTELAAHIQQSIENWIEYEDSQTATATNPAAQP